MGVAGLWAGRPSWRGPAKWCAGVSDISIHTGRRKSRRRRVSRRVSVTLLTRCRHHRLATSVLQFLWTRRVWCRCRRSSMVILHVVPLSRYPDTMKKRYRRPATWSRYPVPGGYLWRLTTLAGYEGAVRSPHVHTLWFLPGPPASASPVVTSRQALPLDYGTAGVKSSQAARMFRIVKDQGSQSIPHGLHHLQDCGVVSRLLFSVVFWIRSITPRHPRSVSGQSPAAWRVLPHSLPWPARRQPVFCNLAASRCDFLRLRI